MSKDFWESQPQLPSLGEKFLLSSKNVDLTHVKMCIYRDCDGLFTYEINLVIFYLYASLSHQRFYCKTEPLFLSSKSMSEDEPGFRYVCNFF